MAAKKIFTKKRREEFLRLMAETGNVTEAARQIGFSRSFFYKLRNKDAEFRREWAEVRMETADRLEAEAIRRAVDGVEEPYFYQGKHCGVTRKFSDPLLMFLLKHRHPDTYGPDGEGGEDGAGGTGRVVFEMHLAGPPGNETPET